MLAAIEPRPPEFMTLHVPLWPMHASSTESRFTLQPEMHRTVNLLSLDINSPEADICHVVDSVPRNLPLGTYRMKLIATANETPPTQQWLRVHLSRGECSQRMDAARVNGPRNP